MGCEQAMAPDDVDYSSFLGVDDMDAEIETEIRPNSKQKPRTAEDAARAARMVEGAISPNGDDGGDASGDGDGSEDAIRRTGDRGVDDRPAGSTGSDPGRGGSGSADGSGLTGFYDTEDEREEAASLVEKTGSKPSPGGRRSTIHDESVLKEIKQEEDSIDLVGDMLMAGGGGEGGQRAVYDPDGSATSPDADLVLDEEAIMGDDAVKPVGKTQSATGKSNDGSERPQNSAVSKSGGSGNDSRTAPSGSGKGSGDNSASRRSGASVAYRSIVSKPTASPAADDDDETVEVAADAIARLEEKALDAIEASREEAAAPAPDLPSPLSPAGDDGDDLEIGENEAKNREKYVIKSTSDYMLVGPGDTGSDPFDIDDVLTDAIDRGASDVHIASMRPIKLRINGTMYKFAKYQIMDPADMNDLIANNGRLINKEMTQKFNTQRSVDTAYVIRRGRRHGERFRVHFAEEMNGPAIVCRHIRPEIFTPEEIGLTPDVVNWGLLSQGMILVTGPTGSGKSATLSSILRNVQVTKPGKIITLEEPIETVYPLDGAADIWQREVPENCPTFVRGITDAMREDPDVILVGEIRDYPTIQAAMQACNTGHLTFATIHANSAPDVVTRILDLAGDADKSELMSNLARNLKGILSQRLLLKPGNDGRVAVREIVQVGRRQKRQIARNDVAAMTADLRARAADLDSQMLMLAIQGKTTLKSARNASMDRAGFDAMVDALSPRVRNMIIDDVTYEPADDDADLVKLDE